MQKESGGESFGLTLKMDGSQAIDKVQAFTKSLELEPPEIRNQMDILLPFLRRLARLHIRRLKSGEYRVRIDLISTRIEQPQDHAEAIALFDGLTEDSLKRFMILLCYEKLSQRLAKKLA